MSFLERKATRWEWSEGDQELKLDDKSKRVIWWFHILLFVPALISLIYNLINVHLVEILINSVIVIPGMILIFLYFKTASFQKIIPRNEIEFAIIKGSSTGTIDLKLSNGRYRQLYFTTRFQHKEFLDFLNSQNITVEERSLYWSLPLNY